MKSKKNSYKLAINGGPKIRTKEFPFYKTIGKEEIKAVEKVLKTGVLSKYLGSWHENFYGGEQINKLEKEWAKYFKVKHAIGVNSATSGLYCAVAACGVGPGDEVIVTPYSMCCSATAPMVFGGVPVFADIEPEYFCLDPNDIERKITEKTKAIIVVDLFGQPYDVERINAIAKEHNLKVIEDAAQAIGSKYGNNYAGTFGDIGCFSFTQGKHLTAGEGGCILTKDTDLAFKCALYRNHTESVIHGMSGVDIENNHVEDLANGLGFNLRMTEIQAAILTEQLDKLEDIINKRDFNVDYITKGIENKIDYIKRYPVRENCRHSWYVLPFSFDEEKAGVKRDKFIEAVKVELTEEESRLDRGVPIGCGYIEPLYKLPLFRQGRHWSCKYGNYHRLKLPVVERLYEKELFLTLYHGLNLSRNDCDDIIRAFIKVHENRGEICG